MEVAGDYSNDLETLTQAMVSDTNPYDVLFLSLNYMPVDRLLQKGYCADLSGDEALMDVARSMYPQFGEILMKDGKLYGLPVDASASTYSVNMDAWEALGLTEDDVDDISGFSREIAGVEIGVMLREGPDGVHRQLGL